MASAGFASNWAATHDSVERLDERLAELARGAGRTRLGLGELLEALTRIGGHHELGFSSLDAYARERCGRSGRWAAEARTLARRLASLPKLRSTLASGELGWAMVELLARHASRDTEANLIERARLSTVRAMRAALTPPGNDRSAASALDARRGDKVSLRLTLSQQDAWLLEWTRRFFEHVERKSDMDSLLSALLAESFDTLSRSLPANDIERCFDDDANLAREQAWQAQLAEWRIEAERRCESNFAARGPGGAPNVVSLRSPTEAGARELDTRIRAASADLGAQEIELARAALAFHASEGPRRLGYSTEAQYARERLGLSYASFKAKISLARRAPVRVQRALELREIGHEAALLISRVASETTAEAWVNRARERTVKHLAEDVRAAELVRDTGGRATPPSDEWVERLRTLEARLLAGDRAAVIEAGSQLSARREKRRVLVSRDTARFFRSLEAVTRKHLPRGTSFVRFLCDVFWDTWRHLCGRDRAYEGVYARDLYGCKSPVCRRRDVTPHHVQFRSAGGSDNDENVIALCSWCHLEGVHGGRIRVSGTATSLKWELGTLRVDGRRVIP